MDFTQDPAAQRRAEELIREFRAERDAVLQLGESTVMPMRRDCPTLSAAEAEIIKDNFDIFDETHPSASIGAPS